MSQRDSGYQRIEHDAYETPAWVTATLVPYLTKYNHKSRWRIWEPAAGTGKMVHTLRQYKFRVLDTDITYSNDKCPFTNFLHVDGFFPAHRDIKAIVTNPPYNLAQEFIQHGLKLMQPRKGLVAMLLRTDFDHAMTRRSLFETCPAFCMKLVLRRRIRWFEDSTGSPSFNHAWFIWDWSTHLKYPRLAYA